MERLLQGVPRAVVCSDEGKSMKLLARFVREESGQDLVEYAFLAIFIALAVTVGLKAIATSLDSGYSNIGTQVSSAS